jgi:hypothetical protein
MVHASQYLASDGTPGCPIYYEGMSDPRNEQRRRYFTYRTRDGLISGTTTSVVFSIDRPADRVWRHFKDFNSWQNSRQHYYSGVVGELEGERVRLTVGHALDDPQAISAEYRVVRVIPEHLIALSQLPLESGPVAGLGGFIVLMLF